MRKTSPFRSLNSLRTSHRSAHLLNGQIGRGPVVADVDDLDAVAVLAPPQPEVPPSRARLGAIHAKGRKHPPLADDRAIDVLPRQELAHGAVAAGEPAATAGPGADRKSSQEQGRPGFADLWIRRLGVRAMHRHGVLSSPGRSGACP